MGILCCPVCKSDLSLDVREEAGDEVIAGALNCSKCNHTYAIEDGIPDLLPPESK